MKIKSVQAYWVHIPIPPDKQHTSDFGRTFDATLVRIETRCGLAGWGEAKRFCRLVEDCNLAWFEEPVTADDKPGQAQVRAATDIPIASGESEFTRHDFRDLAVLGAVDIMQPDLAICGGITEAMRISALASAFNLKLAPHLWAGAPAFAAGLHIAAASPAGFIVEYSLGANPLLHDLVEESFPVKEGLIEVPDRPGLGITVREDFLAKHMVPM